MSNGTPAAGSSSERTGPIHPAGAAGHQPGPATRTGIAPNRISALSAIIFAALAVMLIMAARYQPESCPEYLEHRQAETGISDPEIVLSLPNEQNWIPEERFRFKLLTPRYGPRQNRECRQIANHAGTGAAPRIHGPKTPE